MEAQLFNYLSVKEETEEEQKERSVQKEKYKGMIKHSCIDGQMTQEPKR